MILLFTIFRILKKKVYRDKVKVLVVIFLKVWFQPAQRVVKVKVIW